MGRIMVDKVLGATKQLSAHDSVSHQNDDNDTLSK